MAAGGEEHKAIYKNMVRGTVWAAAMRWGIRGIGLVSIMILARLLTPDDFGVVAMATLTLGLVAGFTELGVAMLLIREQEIDRDHCDTAWTVTIIQGVVVCAILIVAAPLVASYFDDERVIEIIWILGLTGIVASTSNVGMILARKELDFSRDFRFNVYSRLIQFGCTIPLAYFMRNYWAIVYGLVASRVLTVGLSFLMHPYRPRLCLRRFRQYLNFSMSIIPFRLGKFFNEKVDVIVVGGIASTSVFGVYNVASEISKMLTSEIVTAAARGLMPNYSKLSHDPVALAAAYLNVVRASGIIVFPLGFGMCAIASDIVAVMLGSQWMNVVPFVELLAIYAMLAGLVHLMSVQILIACGREQKTAIITWLQLAILAPIVVAAGHFGDAETIALGTVIAVLVVLPYVVYNLVQTLPLTFVAVADALWRSLCAAVLMAAFVRYVSANLTFPVPLNLALEVLAGAVAYTLLLFGLWYFAGRRAGLERTAYNYIVAKMHRVRT